MDVVNPLEIIHEYPITRSTTDNLNNNAGRPKKNNEIKFSSPPKSIIAVLLSNEKSKNNDTQANDSKNLTDRFGATKSSNKHKQHTNLHYCGHSNCTYASNSSSNLIKHKRIHTSEKPFVCDKCTFRTNFQNSLTVHQRIHTCERPYLCQYCDYRCNSSSNLKKHCYHRHSKDKNTNTT